MSYLHVSCPKCTRHVKGKLKKGRKVNMNDKDRLTAAQALVAEFGFPKKVRAGVEAGGAAGGGAAGGGAAQG